MMNQYTANGILQHIVGILSHIYPGNMTRASLLQILVDASPTNDEANIEQIVALAEARGLIEVTTYKQSAHTVVALTAHGFSLGLKDEQITV